MDNYKNKQEKSLNRATYVIVGITLLIAAFAILVGLDLASIGEGGIHFNF